MKTKLLLLIVLLTFKSLTSYSQDTVDLTIHHDTRFLFVGDDRENHVGTIDIVVKLEIPLIKFPKSYIHFFPSIEYANLHKGSSSLHRSVLKRYAIGVSFVRKDLFFKKFNVGIAPHFGYILRENKGASSLGLNIEVSYRLTKRFSLSYIHQIVERSDLTFLYNDTSNIKNSALLGFKVHL